MLGVEEQEVVTGIGQYGGYFRVWGAGGADYGLARFQKIFNSVHVS